MSRFKSVLVPCVLAALSFAPVFAAPEAWKVDPNHSQVGFSIKHLVSRVQGHFNTFGSEIVYDPENVAASKVSAEIDTASIDTGQPNRDKHLKSPDFFNAEKNPKLTFMSTSVSGTKDQMKVAGNLTMNGVTKPVTLDVKFLGSTADPMGPPGGKRAGFEAKTTLNRKDFNILWNKTLDAGGLLLGDDVDVTLLVEAVSAAAAPAPKPAADAKPAPVKPGL